MRRQPWLLLLCSSTRAAAFHAAPLVDEVVATVGRVQRDLDLACNCTRLASPGGAVRVEVAALAREQSAVRRALSSRRHCVVRLDTAIDVEAISRSLPRLPPPAPVGLDRPDECVGEYRDDHSTFVELRFDESGTILPRAAADARIQNAADVLVAAARGVLACLGDYGVPVDYPRAERDEVSATVQRLCRYEPPAAQRRQVFGTHTDTTFLTLIPFAGEPGLELFDGTAWCCPEAAHDAAPGRDVLVMPGDLLHLYSAGRYPVAPHRVVLGGAAPRVSMPLLLRASRAAAFRGSSLSMVAVCAALRATSEEEARSKLLPRRDP